MAAGAAGFSSRQYNVRFSACHSASHGQSGDLAVALHLGSPADTSLNIKGRVVSMID
jgi:hypothetical protein